MLLWWDESCFLIAAAGETILERRKKRGEGFNLNRLLTVQTANSSGTTCNSSSWEFWNSIGVFQTPTVQGSNKKHKTVLIYHKREHPGFLHLNFHLPTPSAIQELILELLLPELAYAGLTPSNSKSSFCHCTCTWTYTVYNVNKTFIAAHVYPVKQWLCYCDTCSLVVELIAIWEFTCYCSSGVNIDCVKEVHVVKPPTTLQVVLLKVVQDFSYLNFGFPNFWTVFTWVVGVLTLHCWPNSKYSRSSNPPPSAIVKALEHTPSTQ